MLSEKIADLLHKFMKAELSEQEAEELEEWLASSPKNRSIFKDQAVDNDKVMLLVIAKYSSKDEWDEFTANLKQQNVIPLPKKRKWFALVAASIMMAIAIFLLQNNISQEKDDHTEIILADGSRISLDSTLGYNIPYQANYRLMVSHDTLLYISLTKKAILEQHETYNTVSVPNGANFKVKLPDGSIAHLNAASSIRYNISNTSLNREVELSGEAYFEVKEMYSGNKKVPFVVKAKTLTGLSQIVEVTGTIFNVNAYCDEGSIKTTLLEGEIVVSSDTSKRIVKPREEWQLNENGFRLSRQHVVRDMPWRGNILEFNKASIHVLEKEISRWYGRRVVIKGEPGIFLTGSIPRSQNFEMLVEILKDFGYSVIEQPSH